MKTCNRDGCDREQFNDRICRECYNERKRSWCARNDQAVDENGSYECTACGETKGSSEFYKNCGSKRGLQSQCKACQRSKMVARAAESKRLAASGVYVFGSDFHPLIKVGFTSGLDGRKAQANTWFPGGVIVRDFLPGAGGRDESRIHMFLSEYRVTGEWFSCDHDLPRFVHENMAHLLADLGASKLRHLNERPRDILMAILDTSSKV